MATEIEAARLMTLSAAAMKDNGENYTLQASMAKLFASEMVNRITAKAVQLHGGYGFYQRIRGRALLPGRAGIYHL